MYTKYINHSRANSQHDLGDMCDYLLSMRFFIVIIELSFNSS